MSINIVNQYYTKVANLYLGIFFEFLTLFDSIFDGILIAVSNKSSLTYVNENNVTLTSFTALKVYIYKKQLGFQIFLDFDEIMIWNFLFLFLSYFIEWLKIWRNLSHTFYSDKNNFYKKGCFFWILKDNNFF